MPLQKRIETTHSFPSRGISLITHATLPVTNVATKDPLTPTGDLDGVEGVTSADAIHLLYYTLFGEGRYPVDQPVDYNKDGAVNSADAIYLLYHTLFGASRYPI